MEQENVPTDEDTADGVILYSEADRTAVDNRMSVMDAVTVLKNLAETRVPNLQLRLIDELPTGGKLVELGEFIEYILSHFNYIFIYLIQNTIDTLKRFQSQMCLLDTILNNSWRVIPILPEKNVRNMPLEMQVLQSLKMWHLKDPDERTRNMFIENFVKTILSGREKVYATKYPSLGASKNVQQPDAATAGRSSKQVPKEPPASSPSKQQSGKSAPHPQRSYKDKTEEDAEPGSDDDSSTDTSEDEEKTGSKEAGTGMHVLKHKHIGGGLTIIRFKPGGNIPNLQVGNKNVMIVGASGNVTKTKKKSMKSKENIKLTVKLPAEILRMDDKSIELYKKALEDGKEKDHSVRIMVTGPYGVGKTAFTKRLMYQDVDINQRNSTDGIDVHVKKCKVSLQSEKQSSEWKVDHTDSKLDDTVQRLANILKSSYGSKMEDRTVIESMETQMVEIDVPIQTVEKSEKNSDELHSSDIPENKTDDQKNKFTSPGMSEDTTAIGKSTNEESIKSEDSDSENPKSISNSEGVDDLEDVNETKRLERELLMKDLKEVINDTSKGDDQEDYANISIWDFGGQFVFYSTHQMFLSHRAIYILIMNLSQQISEFMRDDDPCFDCSGAKSLKIEDYIDIWLYSIHGQSKSEQPNLPPIILVGTHADKLNPETREKEIEAFFGAVRRRFADKDKKAVSLHFIDKDFGLSNATKDSRLAELRHTIMDVVRKQPYWEEEKPAKWIHLEKLLAELRTKGKGFEIMSRSEIEKLNKTLPIPLTGDELELFLRFQHELANIMYFGWKQNGGKSEPAPKNTIVLNPQFLVDALKSLITAASFCEKKPEIFDEWLEFERKGILKTSLLDAVWNRDETRQFSNNREAILALMEHLFIIARHRDEESGSSDANAGKVDTEYLVPCMLKTPPRSIFDSDGVSTPTLCLVLKNVAFPNAIFNRLLAGCISEWGLVKFQIYCGFGKFKIDAQHQLNLSFSCSNVIALTLTRYSYKNEKQPDDSICKNVYMKLKKKLKKIGKCLHLELKFDEYIRCPHNNGDSMTCKHPVKEIMSTEDVFTCDEHGRTHILRPSDLLKNWFDSEETDEDIGETTATGTAEQEDLKIRDKGQMPDSSLSLFKKPVDNTLSEETISQYDKAMKSVGFLSALGNLVGTVFVVGSKYVMTAFHCYRQIIDPLGNGAIILDNLKHQRVYVIFETPSNINRNQIFFKIKNATYTNPQLDIVILELNDSGRLPPPLKLYKPEISVIQVPYVDIIGYGHQHSDKKRLDHTCKVLLPSEPAILSAKGWVRANKAKLKGYLRPGIDPSCVDWGYEDCDRKENIVLSCYLEHGGSGAPILTTKYLESPVVVGVLIKGLPFWFWNLTEEGQFSFPSEFRFEVGTKMTHIAQDIENSNYALACELFQ